MPQNKPRTVQKRRSARSEEVPAIAGDVEEDGDFSVGLDARRPDELDARGYHPVVVRIEVVDAKEEPHRARVLFADDRGLLLTCRSCNLPASA